MSVARPISTFHWPALYPILSTSAAGAILSPVVPVLNVDRSTSSSRNEYNTLGRLWSIIIPDYTYNWNVNAHVCVYIHARCTHKSTHIHARLTYTCPRRDVHLHCQDIALYPMLSTSAAGAFYIHLLSWCLMLIGASRPNRNDGAKGRLSAP